MEITLGHTYRWHATTETYISLACNDATLACNVTLHNLTIEKDFFLQS